MCVCWAHGSSKLCDAISERHTFSDYTENCSNITFFIILPSFSLWIFVVHQELHCLMCLIQWPGKLMMLYMNPSFYKDCQFYDNKCFDCMPSTHLTLSYQSLTNFYRKGVKKWPLKSFMIYPVWDNPHPLPTKIW